MEKLVNEILTYAEQLYGLNESEKEIARYGIQGFLEIGGNMLISVLILYQMHMIPEGIIFFLIFIPMRMFAGGYHMESYIGCLSFSVMILIGVLNISKMIYFNPLALYAGTVFLVLVVWKLSPVIHPNRPVSQKKYQEISQKRNVALFAVLLIYMILFALNQNVLCNIVFLSILLITFMVVIGKIKYRACQMKSTSVRKKAI